MGNGEKKNFWKWADLSDFSSIPIATLKKWRFEKRIPSDIFLRFAANQHARRSVLLIDREKAILWLESHREEPLSA